MPKYRIVSESDPGAEHRESRGTALRRNETRIVTVVEAVDLTEMLDDIQRGFPSTGEVHQGRRIVSVEEVHPGFSYTDAEIDTALRETNLAEEFPDGELLVHGRNAGTSELVQQVVTEVRESGLVPGLNISVLANDPDEPYAMIEVFDEARGIYLSRGIEVRKIADDCDATGWDAVLSIARGLIRFSDDLH